ncbi:MAG: hypothetical protein KOO63_12185 [Bacteroidales bacterium]|nr:hypothetical protein [Candidatus Latescibacterota bacterium]
MTTIVAGLYPPEYQMIDFGHIDLFISNEARTLAWEPVLAWIIAHSGKEMEGNKFTKN